MVILQHVWRRWTRATRAAADAAVRNALPEAWPLKPPGGRLPPGRIWIHQVRAFEAEAYEPVQTAAALTHAEWAQALPAHPANLHWRVKGERVELSLTPPWEGLRQTKWPAWLPSPLVTVGAGEVVRLDWNGRFYASLAGGKRSYFYDWHTYWAAVSDDPGPELFIHAVPRKAADFRTGIY
jgi:hypothetical protein